MPKHNKASGLDRSAYEQLVQSVVDYAIFRLDPEGHVLSWNPGAVATPDRGALEGITRLSVEELCEELGLPFSARPVPASELQDADEIFLSTTAGGIMPVSRLDGRIYCNDRPGPISARLRETFWAKRAEGWHATPIEYGADA